MRIAREEVFGPSLAIIPFDTEGEAMAIANDMAGREPSLIFRRQEEARWRLERVAV